MKVCFLLFATNKRHMHNVRQKQTHNCILSQRVYTHAYEKLPFSHCYLSRPLWLASCVGLSPLGYHGWSMIMCFTMSIFIFQTEMKRESDLPLSLRFFDGSFFRISTRLFILLFLHFFCLVRQCFVFLPFESRREYRNSFHGVFRHLKYCWVTYSLCTCGRFYVARS